MGIYTYVYNAGIDSYRVLFDIAGVSGFPAKSDKCVNVGFFGRRFYRVVELQAHAW